MYPCAFQKSNYLPCERRTRYRLSQPDTVVISGQSTFVVGVPMTTFLSAATLECHVADTRHDIPHYIHGPTCCTIRTPSQMQGETTSPQTSTSTVWPAPKYGPMHSPNQPVPNSSRPLDRDVASIF